MGEMSDPGVKLPPGAGREKCEVAFAVEWVDPLWSLAGWWVNPPCVGTAVSHWHGRAVAGTPCTYCKHGVFSPLAWVRDGHNT